MPMSSQAVIDNRWSITARSCSPAAQACACTSSWPAEVSSEPSVAGAASRRISCSSPAARLWMGDRPACGPGSTASWALRPVNWLSMQPVQALHADLGEVGQGGGDGVHAQPDRDGVVAGGGGEPAVQEGGGIRRRGKEKVPGDGEVVQGALRVGEGLRGDAERHRGLHEIGSAGGIRCAGTDVIEDGGEHGVGAGQRGVVDRAGRAEHVDGHGGGERLELHRLRGLGAAHVGVRQRQRGALDQARAFLGAQRKRLGLAALEGVGGRLLDAVLQHRADADEGLERMGERDDLAGAAQRRARHGRQEAVVEPVGQELDEFGAGGGGRREQAVQLHRQQRPDVLRPAATAGRRRPVR